MPTTGRRMGRVVTAVVARMASMVWLATWPTLSPVIGMDKDEIILTSRKIDTFETSILPYENCCTVFTPKHPNTKPKMPKILEAESHLDVDALVDEAVAGVEIVHLP